MFGSKTVSLVSVGIFSKYLRRLTTRLLLFMRKCNLIGEIKQRKKYYFGIKRTWLTNTKVVSNFKYGTDIVVTQRVRVVSK